MPYLSTLLAIILFGLRLLSIPDVPAQAQLHSFHNFSYQLLYPSLFHSGFFNFYDGLFLRPATNNAHYIAIHYYFLRQMYQLKSNCYSLHNFSFFAYSSILNSLTFPVAYFLYRLPIMPIVLLFFTFYSRCTNSSYFLSLIF